MATVYRDSTPLTDAQKASLEGLATAIRSKKYGKDVREAMASAVELVGTPGSEWETGLLKNGMTLLGDDIQTPAYFDDGQSADDSFYISSYIYRPRTLHKILLQCLTAGTVTIFLFEIPSDNLAAGDKTDLTLVFKTTVTTIAGLNTIPISYTPNKRFLIGLQGAGWSYLMQPIAGSTSKDDLTDSAIGTVFKNQSFSLDNTGKAVFPAITLLYNDYAYQMQDDKQGKLLSTALPAYARNTYPITFDFTNLKVHVQTGGYLENHESSDLGFISLTGDIDLPMYNLTDDIQSFFLVYDLNANKLSVLRNTGNVAGLNGTRLKIIAGFSIRDAKTGIKKKINFYDYNRNDTLVILQHAQTGNDENGGTNNTANAMEDYASQRIIDNGLYFFNYKSYGDSITGGENPENDYKPMYGNRYGDLVAQTLGMFTYIDGIGGTTICNHKNGIYARIANDKDDYDIASVMGGTNDYAAGIAMGTTDGRDTDMSHFYPAFENIMQSAVSRKGLFFVITPTQRENGSTQNAVGLTLEDYVNAEISLAKKYGIPVLDLYHTFQYTAGISSFYKTVYMPDGLHPNIAGMEKIGNRIIAFIQSLIKQR